MSKKLIIYSWNVLNPTIHINAMSWKKYLNEKASQMATIDYTRFTLYRKQAILNIIMYWLQSPHVVICLQEVCKELLESIKCIDAYVCYTKYHNNDHRVTIVKGYNVRKEYIDITINNVKKDGLKVTLDNDMEIYNLHLHWKWTNSDNIKVAKIILPKVKKEKFIICGDMNKTAVNMQSFLDEFDCLYVADVKGYTGYDLTGKQVIDHIFVSVAIEDKSNIKILKHIKDHSIMYDFKKIIKLYNKGGFTSESWLYNRENKDVSDHRPIRVIIKN